MIARKAGSIPAACGDAALLAAQEENDAGVKFTLRETDK